MNPDKRIIIDDLTARVNASPFLIVVDYTSITVPEFTNLRSALVCLRRSVPRSQEQLHAHGSDGCWPSRHRGTPRRPDRFRDRRIRRSEAPPRPSTPLPRLPRKPNTRWRSWMEPFFPRTKSAPSANCLPATSCLPNSLALSTRPVPLLPELFRHMWTKKTAAAKNPPPNTNPLTGRSGCTLAKCVKTGPDSPTGSLSELRPEN